MSLCYVPPVSHPLPGAPSQHPNTQHKPIHSIHVEDDTMFWCFLFAKISAFVVCPHVIACHSFNLVFWYMFAAASSTQRTRWIESAYQMQLRTIDRTEYHRSQRRTSTCIQRDSRFMVRFVLNNCAYKRPTRQWHTTIAIVPNEKRNSKWPMDRGRRLINAQKYITIIRHRSKSTWHELAQRSQRNVSFSKTLFWGSAGMTAWQM